MIVWVLIVFSFNMNHMTLQTKEFYTQDACIKAANLVIASMNEVGKVPVTKTLKVDCIKDIKGTLVTDPDLIQQLEAQPEN